MRLSASELAVLLSRVTARTPAPAIATQRVRRAVAKVSRRSLPIPHLRHLSHLLLRRLHLRLRLRLLHPAERTSGRTAG